MFKRQGFTIIELVMVLVILGILAAVAIPRYFNLQNQAQTNAEAGVVGAVRAGIATVYANSCAGGACVWPAALDAAAAGACTVANPCFDTVLAQGGITSGWTKADGDEDGDYTFDATTNTYQYDADSEGSFLLQP